MNVVNLFEEGIGIDTVLVGGFILSYLILLTPRIRKWR